MEDEVLLSIYENAWNVFHNQHAQSSRGTLRSLKPLHSWAGQHDGSALPFGPTDIYHTKAGQPEPELPDEDLVHREEIEPPDRAKHWLFVDRYSQRRPSAVQRPRLRCSTIKPCPQYESVDVIVQNVFLGENEKVFQPRVLPFSDDPTFLRYHAHNFIVQHGSVLETDDEYQEWKVKCQATRPFASTRPEESAVEVLAVMQVVDDLLPDSGNRLETEHKNLHERLQNFEEANQRCRVFVDGIIPSASGEGILHRITNDRVLHWPPLAKYRKSHRLAVVVNLFKDYAKRRSLSLSEMTQSLLKSGCSRAACLHTFCESHPPISTPTLDTEEPFLLALRSLPRKARRPADVLSTAAIDDARSKTTPCGPDCFLHLGLETDASDMVWDRTADQELAFQVAICPDLGPCDLAFIVGKPCWEVYTKRKDFEMMARDHPEVDSFFNFRPKEAEKPVSALFEVRNESKSLTVRTRAKANPRGPHEPCDHDGPCTTGVCSCYRMNGHCESSCGCEDGCGRKFIGCHCCGSGKGNGCGKNSKCPCRARGRDCNIGVCGKQNNKKPSQLCSNIATTNDESAEVMLYNGAFGYGIFAKKRIQPGTFLGLYVGEVLKCRRSEIQEVLAEHTQRNYLFTLHKGERRDGKTIPRGKEDIPTRSDELASRARMDCDAHGWHYHSTVDSAEAGNSTRFANHIDAPEKINAQAEHRWVQGDIVIAFYATKTIEKHKEIVINYGEDYFRHMLGDGSDSHAAAVDVESSSDTGSD